MLPLHGLVPNVHTIHTLFLLRAQLTLTISPVPGYLYAHFVCNSLLATAFPLGFYLGVVLVRALALDTPIPFFSFLSFIQLRYPPMACRLS